MKRRSFLKAAATTTAMGLAAHRLQSTVHAQGVGRPRFIFIYTAVGREPSWMTGTPGPNFKLSPGMSMFEPYKSKMCVFEGFTVPNFGYEINSHWGSLHCLLSGKPSLQRPGESGGALSEGCQRSFDHLLADRIGKRDPVPNIVLGGHDRNSDHGSLQASWVAPKIAQNPIHDPDKAFATLFGGSAAPVATDPATIEARKRQRLWQKDILGLSRDQLAVFRNRLGGPERVQLEAYESHLADAYKAVATDGADIAAEGAKCPVTTYEDITKGVPSVTSFQRQHDLQSRILAAALACGRTSVGVFVMGGVRNGMTVPGGSGAHHLHNDSAVDHYKAFDAYYNARVKTLLDELAKYPEGDGTVLDNTIVLWSSDIGWTPVDHDHDNIPIYMFGGVPGRKLKMGQYVKSPYTGFGRDRRKALAFPGNRRLHEILLTLAASMGINDLHGFADPMYVHGPVQELIP